MAWAPTDQTVQKHPGSLHWHTQEKSSRGAGLGKRRGAPLGLSREHMQKSGLPLPPEAIGDSPSSCGGVGEYLLGGKVAERKEMLFGTA